MQLEDHENRLRKLEQNNISPDRTPEELWPEWQVHKVYKTGDKITFIDGKHYTCKLPETVASTTWSPSDYPDYWVSENL